MIKYICDICGKEAKVMHKYCLPDVEDMCVKDAHGNELMRISNRKFSATNKDVCSECEKKIYMLVNDIVPFLDMGKYTINFRFNDDFFNKGDIRI